MSTKYFTAAPSAADINLSPKSTHDPSKTTDNPHAPPVQPLDPAEYIIEGLEKMAILGSATESGEDASQHVPPTLSDIVTRMHENEDALGELFSMTLAHARLLRNLQDGNRSLRQQLASVNTRFNLLERELVQNHGAGSMQHGLRAVPSGAHDQSLWMDSITTPLGHEWQDMSDIATTLAVAPNDQLVSSRSSSSSFQSLKERRPSRPYR